MPGLTTLMVFSLVTLLLVATPGPGVLFVVGRSMDQGRRAGIASMLGIESAEVVYVIGAAAGLSALLAASAAALATLRYVGAVYLIVLGVRRWRQGAVRTDLRPPSHRRVFVHAFVVQMLNPKVAIFFLAYFPQFLRPGQAVAPQVLLLGSLYVMIACASDATYVLLAAEASRRLADGARARKRLARLTALIYVALGVFAAASGERSLAARRA